MPFVMKMCLIASLTFLMACEQVYLDCSWSDQIRFKDTTKEWLQSQDWPEAAYEDFNKIRNHNRLYDRHCE